MNTLQFYTNPNSRGRMVRWLLEELNLEYNVKSLAYGTEMKSEAYLKINPLGKVPTIVHRGKVITECGAICCYLADTFTKVNLAPLERERADYYRWLFYATGPLELLITDRLRKVENQRGWKAFASHGGNHEETLQILKDALGKHRYIAGERFTAADIYVGYQLALGMYFKVIPRDPVFSAYWNKLKNRPAFLRAKKWDDELAKTMG
jgi:glutathione S-transferase